MRDLSVVYTGLVTPETNTSLRDLSVVYTNPEGSEPKNKIRDLSTAYTEPIQPSYAQTPLTPEIPYDKYPMDRKFDVPELSATTNEPVKDIPELRYESDPYYKVIPKALVKGAMAVPKAVSSGLEIMKKAVSAEDNPFMPTGATYEDLGALKQTTQALEKEVTPVIRPEERAKQIVASTAESVGTMVGTGFNLPLMATSEGLQKTQQLSDEGVPLPKAAGIGTLRGLTEYFTEKLPFKALKENAPFLKRLVNGLKTDAPGEVISTLEEMGVEDDILLGKDHTWDEYKRAVADTLAVSGLTTAGATTITQPMVDATRPKTETPKEQPPIQKDVAPQVIPIPIDKAAMSKLPVSEEQPTKRLGFFEKMAQEELAKSATEEREKVPEGMILIGKQPDGTRVYTSKEPSPVTSFGKRPAPEVPSARPEPIPTVKENLTVQEPIQPVVPKGGAPLPEVLVQNKDGEWVLETQEPQQPTIAKSATVEPILSTQEQIKDPKGKEYIKLSPSKKATLEQIRTDIAGREASKRIPKVDSEGNIIDWTVTGTGYPEYFKGKGLTKEKVLGIIDKALDGFPLTKKQKTVIDDLNTDYRSSIAREQVKERAKPKKVSAIDLDVGDTYKIYGEQYKVKEVHDNGNVTVKDGVEKTLTPDDTVNIDRGTLKKATSPEEASDFNVSGLADAKTHYAPKRESARPLIEAPELLELAQRINEGKSPKLKEKLRLMGGRAFGALSIKGEIGEQTADISLRRDLFAGNLLNELPVKPKEAASAFESFKKTTVEATGIPESDIVFRKEYDKKTGKVILRAYDGDKQLAPKVMSHEIGHLVDWLEEGDIKRGNILGRLASLKKFMKNYIESTPLEINEGKLTSGENISRKEIMKELKDVSQAWKPFEEIKGDKYTQYRNSSVELYADAISVLANDPQLLQEKAPKFYKAFMAYMVNKPNVKSIYDDIVERKSDRETLVDKRIDNIYKMFGEGDIAREELRKRNIELEEGIKDTAMRWFIDEKYAALKYTGKQEKQGGIVSERARETRYDLEEMNYLSSVADDYFHNFHTDIIQEAENQGISSKDIGIYVFLNRVVSERQNIANPKGQTEDTAGESLFRFRQRIGEQKYETIRDLFHNRFWKLRNDTVISKIEESRFFSPEQIKEIKENTNYGKFSVLHYLEDKYGTGITSKIYEQKGTLSDIENPLIPTVLQDMSLLRAVEINNTKKDLISVLEVASKDDESLIQRAKTRYSEDSKGLVPIEPKDPKLDILTVMIDGKPQHYYVSKEITNLFKNAPYEATKIAQAWYSTNDVIRSVLVSKNPLWMARNVIRDFRSTVKNLPDIKLHRTDIFKLMNDYRKALPETWNDVMKGKRSEDIQTMMKGKMLLSGRAYSGKDTNYDNEFDRLATEFDLVEASKSEADYSKLRKAWNYLDKIGELTEKTAKVAGYKYLKNRTDKSAREIAHLVRTRIGTPDVKRRGALNAITNNIFMFSNVNKEGLRSSLESFKEDKSAYIIKTVILNMLPKAILLGALSYGDDDTKKMIENIPEYDIKNKTVVPLWRTTDGSTTYLTISEDYEGQTFGALAYDLMKGNIVGESSAIETTSQFNPYKKHPLLVVGEDLYEYYVKGRNPYDEYRGRPILSDLVYRTGGIEAQKQMGKYTWKGLGGSPIYSPDDVISIMKLPPFNILGTLIKTSKRGLEDKYRKVLKEMREEKDELSLDKQNIIKEGIAKGKTNEQIQNELLKNGINPAKAKPQIKRWRALKSDNPQVKSLGMAKSNIEREQLLTEFRKTKSEEEVNNILELYMNGE